MNLMDALHTMKGYDRLTREAWDSESHFLFRTKTGRMIERVEHEGLIEERQPKLSLKDNYANDWKII